MPLYEYRCEDCGEEFLELRSMSDREAPIACPDCGGNGHALISQVAPGRAEGHREPACAPGST